MPPKKTDPDLPSTLLRSAQKVQDVYEKSLEAAEETYDGDEARAHRTAWSAVKHVAEKKGDHWEVKDEYGPSDARAARGGPPDRGREETAGGVDATKTKKELMDDARAADVEGRSTMTKDELVEALQKSNDRETARARQDD